jgi:NarL family two-component system response regulator LiaR
MRAVPPDRREPPTTFTLLASGNSNEEIGSDLSVSTNTVSNHIKSILAELHLDNRIQAAVQAVRTGIS